MADKNTATGNGDKGTDNGEQPFLGTWATKEAAEEGISNMQAMIDKQGNVVGTLRGQVEFANQIINNQQQPAPKTTDTPEKNYSKDIAAIRKEMSALDPEDVDYQSNLMELMNKSNDLVALEQHNKTLGAATELFKAELDERDVRATHKDFYDKNPDFNTPEMQTQIKERMSADTTGMLDSLSAFREIQRDAAMQKATELENENSELKRIAGLAKGTDATGKVITKGQSPQQTAQHKKVTGAERDKGMLDVLNAL